MNTLVVVAMRGAAAQMAHVIDDVSVSEHCSPRACDVIVRIDRSRGYVDRMKGRNAERRQVKASWSSVVVVVIVVCPFADDQVAGVVTEGTLDAGRPQSLESTPVPAVIRDVVISHVLHALTSMPIVGRCHATAVIREQRTSGALYRHATVERHRKEQSPQAAARGAAVPRHWRHLAVARPYLGQAIVARQLIQAVMAGQAVEHATGAAQHQVLVVASVTPEVDVGAPAVRNDVT